MTLRFNRIRLRGVGPQTAKYLARLDIYSTSDLLFHLPTRYQDRTTIQPMGKLRLNQEAVVEGVIHAVHQPGRGRTQLWCELHDETGSIVLRFFHVQFFQLSALKPGTRLRCYGSVRFGPEGCEMVHPEYHVMTSSQTLPVDTHLTSIYSTTEGLSQYTLRKLISHALEVMEGDPSFQELLPDALLQGLSLPTLKEALHFIHHPPREVSMTELMENKTAAQKRLVFEELLAHRVSLLHLKKIFQTRASVACMAPDILIKKFLQQLPFQLTTAQQRVAHEINIDLSRSSPMLRLLQGDVGSGKTVIAALAMLQVIQQGYQAAMMAPTELLAEQHYRVLKHYLEPLDLHLVLLSGHLKTSEKAKVLRKMANGEAQLIVGTHALFQEEVIFSQLALLIVDEQHRFGVHQRALFRAKGKQHYYPHQLVMTATPIPRTLALSAYADIDCSIIDELPPGRTPVSTSVMPNTRRSDVIERLQTACEAGRQAYWVCPLIEASEAISAQSAMETARQLQVALPQFKIGLIHGRLKSDAKESIMRAFQCGDIHILVATTVIEVGVDVANASVMVIENAERLGLSQLHQLRGRVGRGSVMSHCILLYEPPLSDLAKERLAVMRDTNDGFQIAQRDLELRGPGDILGLRQTGEFAFRVADLMRDSTLLPEVYQATEVIMREQTSIIEPLMRRWLRKC